MTKTQLLALDRSLFTTHTTTIKPGHTWSFKEFQRRFKTHYPKLANLDCNNPQDWLAITSIYTSINKLLRKRGMAIKSSKYYSRFEVLEDASEKVTYLASKVQRITAYRNDLALGLMAHGGQYSARLDSTEIESIENEADFYPGRVPYGAKN